MTGTSLQFVSANGDDRFYNDAKDRKSRTRGGGAGAGAGAGTGTRDSPAVQVKAVVPDWRESEEIGRTTATANLSSESNLDLFLKSTTPSVPAQYLPKTRMRGWRACDEECRPYFTLGDLWNSYKEWSAYGAGVPLVLNGSDCVVQYYVPYLSGIQLYGKSSRQANDSRLLLSRQPGEDSDDDSYIDSSSDGTSDCETERSLKYASDRCGNHLLKGSTIGLDRLSMRENHVTMQEVFLSDDSDTGNSQGHLLFQYLERDLPYTREPLADKISDLANRFPVMTYRSCDLLPASWFSVAWYPIYRIPTGPSLKDLDACFLTFHSLSTPSRGASTNMGSASSGSQGVATPPMVNVPTTDTDELFVDIYEDTSQDAPAPPLSADAPSSAIPDASVEVPDHDDANMDIDPISATLESISAMSAHEQEYISGILLVSSYQTAYERGASQDSPVVILDP